MTTADFRDLVYAMARTEGTPYIKPTETAKFNDLLQEQLNVYASKTQCIQSDRVVFTPEVGRAVYTTFSTPQNYGDSTVPEWFDAALCFVRYVHIEGAPLMILGSDPPAPGESSEFEVTRRLGSYLTADNNKPIAWWQENPNQLLFNCPFDQVYEDCYVAGRCYHPPISMESDNDPIALPPEDLRPAAMLCQGHLLYPHAPVKAAAILGACERLMEKRRDEVGVKSGGHPTRGNVTPVTSYNLSR